MVRKPREYPEDKCTVSTAEEGKFPAGFESKFRRVTKLEQKKKVKHLSCVSWALFYCFIKICTSTVAHVPSDSARGYTILYAPWLFKKFYVLRYYAGLDRSFSYASNRTAGTLSLVYLAT